MSQLEAQNFLNKRSPLQILKAWMNEAQNLKTLREPTAMTVSTFDRQNNMPNTRVVLCKEIRPDSLLFYTNYESQKGLEIHTHPQISAHFFWDPLIRQVRLQGHAEKISSAESDQYWQTRQRDSQLAQYVSAQSKAVASRQYMDEQFTKIRDHFRDQPIPRPLHWGGYAFFPTYVEFWIGRENRFHDRFAYRKVETRWEGTRLFP